MFFIFNRACKKYEFAYSLNASGESYLMLHPNDTFENIKVSMGYCSDNFTKLFLMAIKKMKEYRRKGC